MTSHAEAATDNDSAGKIVWRARWNMLRAFRNAALLLAVFLLTVLTGGGRALSSPAFAVVSGREPNRIALR